MPVSTIKLLENFADFCALKNKVISKNIANVGTQNYQSEDVEFKNVLNENMTSALKTTELRHIGGNQINSLPQFEVKIDKSTDNVSGVNNVDIDKQMAELAENQLNFSFVSQKIGEYFKNIQMVINGNGGQ